MLGESLAMSTATLPFVAQQPRSEPHLTRRPLALSLSTLLLLVTAFAAGLGLGRIVWYGQGFADGYAHGFVEGPLRTNPGTPDNWTPPSPGGRSSVGR